MSEKCPARVIPTPSLYNLKVILKMVKILTHQPYTCIIMMVIIRCIDSHVRRVPRGSSPPPLLCNLEIILKMVDIPTHKPYIILMIMRKMHFLIYQTSAIYTQVTIKAFKFCFRFVGEKIHAFSRS